MRVPQVLVQDESTGGNATYVHGLRWDVALPAPDADGVLALPLTAYVDAAFSEVVAREAEMHAQQ